MVKRAGNHKVKDIDFPFLLIIGSLTLESNYSSSRVHWRFMELLILLQLFFAVTQVTELTPVWTARFGFYIQKLLETREE